MINMKHETCVTLYYLDQLMHNICRSRWPRGLRRCSAAARLLRWWVWIPPGAWMSVRSECCVLSGRGLCDELITRPEESYLLWCIVVCDLENLVNEEVMAHWGLSRQKQKTNKMHNIYINDELFYLNYSYMFRCICIIFREFYFLFVEVKANRK